MAGKPSARDVRLGRNLKLQIAIPYRNSDGTLHRKRLRAALHKMADGSDERMRWDGSGNGTILHGLDKLALAGDQPLLLVEGESDAQTAWH